jgi:hypothetical protein
MKITKALLLSAAIIASACSDDDDKKSSLENAKLSFAQDATVIEAPAGLQNSSDEHAQMANQWVMLANGMTQYFSFMQFPEGASKSNTRITAANGRTKQTGDVLVYIWSDDQSGYSIGYQVSEESDKYVWEIFLKENGGDWLKYFHAEEKKDRSAGLMKVYDIYGDGGDNTSAVIFQYEWARANGELTLTFSDSFSDSVLEIVINENTGAGSVVSIEDGITTYEMTWDAAGNGTWTYYDETGEVSDSGTWEA